MGTKIVSVLLERAIAGADVLQEAIRGGGRATELARSGVQLLGRAVDALDLARKAAGLAVFLARGQLRRRLRVVRGDPPAGYHDAAALLRTLQAGSPRCPS